MNTLILLLVVGLTEVALLLWLLHSGWALRIAADVPNHRSLHAKITPRIGGLVMMPLVLLPVLAYLPGMRVVALAALLLWLLSFVDDRYDLPILVRLVGHLAAAISILLMSDPAVQHPQYSILIVELVLLVWATNLYNFMDGADGLAGGMALFGFFFYGFATWPVFPELVQMSSLVSIAAAGFLLFNFPPAKIFLGDAGSVPLGFLAAALGILGWQQNLWPGWFPVLVFSPFIVDATMTLLKRAIRGERIWQAHREHYYQRLVRMGWTHRRLAITEYVLMSAAGISAVVMRDMNLSMQYGGLILWVAGYILIMVVIDIRWKKFLAIEGAA